MDNISENEGNNAEAAAFMMSTQPKEKESAIMAGPKFFLAEARKRLQ